MIDKKFSSIFSGAKLVLINWVDTFLGKESKDKLINNTEQYAPVTSKELSSKFFKLNELEDSYTKAFALNDGFTNNIRTNMGLKTEEALVKTLQRDNAIVGCSRIHAIANEMSKKTQDAAGKGTIDKLILDNVANILTRGG